MFFDSSYRDSFINSINRFSSDTFLHGYELKKFSCLNVIIIYYVGVKYLNDCPVQPNLPVYLLVVGSMGLVRVLNLLWKQFRRRRMRKLEGVELDQEEEPANGLVFKYIFLSNISSFRWIEIYWCCIKSFSFFLVYRRTILDMAYL